MELVTLIDEEWEHADNLSALETESNKRRDGLSAAKGACMHVKGLLHSVVG